jgi:hypothetical protein
MTWVEQLLQTRQMQFLMKQSPTAIERLKTVFNLSEGEKNFLLSADKGQGLFFAGSNHVAIQVVSSQMEHELITSDPKDLEKLRTRTGEDKRTIEELAQLMNHQQCRLQLREESMLIRMVCVRLSPSERAS